MNKRVPYLRRRKQLTNYRKREKLIISNLPRLVVRLSNKHVNAQFINYKSDGDETITAFNSVKIKDYAGKNLQSAYLTGLSAGLKAAKKSVKKAVLDTGLKQPVKNSRIYACLKGALDAGIQIPHDASVLPSDELIKKKNLTEAINKIKGEFK